MGVARGPGDPPLQISENEERLRRYKCILQALVVAYVVCYSMLYKNTHLQKEKVRGTIDVGAWPGDSAKDPKTFAGLPYCGEATYWLEKACSAIKESDYRDEKYGQPRFEPARNRVGEVVCCSSDGSSSRYGRDGNCFSESSETFSFYEAKTVCEEERGMHLCTSSSEIDLSCDSGCAIDDALVWTWLQGDSNGQPRRCEFVNELDALSFDAEYTFIPTHVTVVHQRASCMEGEKDTTWCKLDYKTDASSTTTLDEYLIGNVEDFQLSFAHTFHTDLTGDGTMFDAEQGGIPVCDEADDTAAICRDAAPGGHDRTSVGGLLKLLGITLESNNDATDHPNHTEEFRTSGLKIQLNVQYSNLPPRWWRRSGSRLRYEYEAHVVPSEGVWHGLTLDPETEARAWVSMRQLRALGANDRVLVWADGIEIRTRITGEVGHLEPQALLLTVASALPLLFFARNIVELVCGSWRANLHDPEVGTGEEATGAGARREGDALQSSFLRSDGGVTSKGHEGDDGL